MDGTFWEMCLVHILNKVSNAQSYAQAGKIIDSGIHADPTMLLAGDASLIWNGEEITLEWPQAASDGIQNEYDGVQVNNSYVIKFGEVVIPWD